MQHVPTLVCVAFAFFFLVLLVRDLERGEQVGVHPRWTGLGGGGGGWTLTRPAVYILLALVFGLSGAILHHPREASKAGKSGSDATVQQSPKQTS